ncbi:MAG: hypothetical protein IJ980_00480 [Oscillospiraceae bacterium]|nr:hypothetical protein [Oscillospiraceae bacterium]
MCVLRAIRAEKSVGRAIPSRGEGRRLIQQGGLTVDDEKVTTIDFAVSQDRLQAGVKIRKGKKVFHKAILK